MTDDERLMQQALEALETNQYAVADAAPHRDVMAYNDAITALRERMEQPEQEFTTHEEGEDGWSDWVCPDLKSYLMKCCDCGLVHEAQFAVVRYKSDTEREDCDIVDDPNLQAVFRMRRSEQWTPKDTAYRPGGLAQPEQEPVAWIDQSVIAWLADRKGKTSAHCTTRLSAGKSPEQPMAIYTAPLQRREWVGLTDEECDDLWDKQLFHITDKYSAREFIRDVEAAHGIKGDA